MQATTSRDRTRPAARAASVVRFAGCVVALCSAIGCAGQVASDEPSARADAELQRVRIENPENLSLLARVDTGNGGAVEFYEAEPGHVFVLESGRIGQAPALPAEASGMQAAQQYEYLTGEAAPAALLAAEARSLEVAGATLEVEALPDEAELDVEQAPAAFAPSAAADLPEGVAVNQQALTESEFRSTYCPIAGDYGRQLIWTHVTGTGSFTWTRMDWVQSAAMSLRGTVRARARWRPRASWSDWSNVQLPAGYWVRWYEKYRPRLGFGWNGMVDQADGDLYHFCSIGDKNY